MTVIPVTPEAFIDAMRTLEVPLPMAPSETFGVIADANGRDLLTIDVNGDLPDEVVELMVAFFAQALNGYAGFEPMIELNEAGA